MGACASVPKGFKAEAGAVAPPPEPPKEEVTATATAGAPEVPEVKDEEREKKVDGTGNDDKPKNDNDVVKEEKVAEDVDNKHQSLDTLMSDKGEAKEESATATPATVVAEAVPSTAVKTEEEKVEPPPVYDSPPKKDDKSEKPSTDIAEVTKEEKKIEEKTQQ